MSQRNTRPSITEVDTFIKGDCFSMACPRDAEYCLVELGKGAMTSSLLAECREAAISGIWAAFPHAGDRQISAVQSLQQAASHEELRATLQCVSAAVSYTHLFYSGGHMSGGSAWRQGAE